MNNNTKQSSCPVRGLTPAGHALVKKLKEEHSLFIKETVEFFMANDIITLDDVLNLTEEALMNKILKQVHPYSVYYSESDMRWHTYLKDDTQLSGRKPIARKKKSDTDDFEVLTKCQHIIIDSDTKGEFGERIVDLTDDALYILQLLKEYYETENLVSEWLFVNKSGRIHNRAMDLRIRRYCRLAGINEKSLHKIRSTYISLLRDAGVSFEKIAEEVGHKSVLTTMLNYSFDTQNDVENKRLINKGLNIHTA